MNLGRRSALAMTLASAAPASAAPAGAVREEWTDPARNRTLPVLLRVPSGRGPFPAVIVSHGLGGSREGMAYLGRALAGAGFAVLHLQHPGSDRAIWEGRSDAFQGVAGAVRDPRTAVDRLRDLAFAVEELPRRVSVDTAHMAAAGHSFGSWTVQHVLGQALPLPIPIPGVPDRRLRAGVLLSPVPGFFGVNAAGIRVPLLHITGTNDTTMIDRAGPEDRLAVFHAVEGVPQAAAVFEGAQHLAFAGVEETGAGRASAAFHNRTAEIAVLFLRATVLGDDRARAEIASRPRSLSPADAYLTKGWR